MEKIGHKQIEQIGEILKSNSLKNFQKDSLIRNVWKNQGYLEPWEFIGQPNSLRTLKKNLKTYKTKKVKK